MKKTFLIGLGIIVIALVIALGIIFIPRPAKAPVVQQGNGNEIAAVATTSAPMKMAPIPQGSQTYQIMQAASVMPKIVQATIDPVNVHVGDTQTLTVIISDPNPITSVVAVTETDHGTTTLPLALVGPAALNDVAPQKYFVNSQSQLVLTDPAKGNGGGDVAMAAEGDVKYSAQWKVEDTHTARYTTTFTATDAKGNVNSAHLNWTDSLCSWNGNNNYGGGTWDANSTYGSGGCSFASNETDGVENGNMTIDAPITLASGSTLVINSGHSITLSGSGSLTLPSTSQIVTGGEMYCASSGWSTTFSNPTDGTYQVARSGLSNNVYPGQTNYFTTATTTNYGTNTYDYNCASAISYEYSGSGSLTNSGECSGPNSCNAPQGTLGIEGTVGCGGAVQQVVDEGNIAACSGGSAHCDVWASVSTGYNQGCY